MASGEGQTSVSSSGVWSGYVTYNWNEQGDGTCYVTANFLLKRSDGPKSDNNGWSGWFHFNNGDDGEFNYSNIGKSYAVKCTISDYFDLDEDGYVDISISAYSEGVRCTANFTAGSGVPYGRKSNVFVDPHDHVKMGENLFIWMEGGAGYITHNLSYKIGTMSSYTSIAYDVESAYSWTVPDLMAYLTDPKGDELTIKCDTYTTNGTYKGTSTTTVDCIPQDATVPNIANDVILGQETTIDLPRILDSYALTLRYKLAGETVTLFEKQKVDSYKWTPDLKLAKKFPADWTAEGVIVCETYNGSTKLGENQRYFRFVLMDSTTIRPGPVSTKVSLSNEHLPEGFRNLYIQKLSHVSVLGRYIYTDYSEIASVTFQIGSDYIIALPEYSGDTAGHKMYTAEAVFTRLSGSGTLKVVTTIRDQRGCERAGSNTITVLPYETPAIIPYDGMAEILCARTNKDGITKRDGGYLLIQAGKQHTDISCTSGGVEYQNKSKLQWRIRQTEGVWGDWQLLLGEEDASQIKKLIEGAVSNPQAGYDIELQCSDTLGGSRTMQFKVRTDSVSFVLFDGENGAAFGKYPEAAGRVEVADNMKFICFGEADFQGTVRFPGSGWVDMELCNGITGTTGLGNHPVGGVRYRVENHNRVYVEIAVKFQVTARVNKMAVAVIPEEITPSSGGQSPACLGRYGFYLGQFQMDFQSGYIYFNGLYPDPLEPSSYPFGVNGMCGEISYFLD